ncbi:MAG: flagellar hook-basal body complex protein FliE [Candidatus Gastranaerophilales bacterium]|nr:flagellar hook-basal body complex protein FliE [Candidatus Gastranaerophilales bacterium]
MIENKYVPNINIFSDLSSSMPIEGFSKKNFTANNLNETEGTSFKDVLSGLVSNLNDEIEKPDQLFNEQLMGNSDVDIHDVMTAVAKAEIGITLATQVTSKVVTAYNTVMNISI